MKRFRRHLKLAVQRLLLVGLASLCLATSAPFAQAAPLTRVGPNPADFANLPGLSYHLSNSTSTPDDTEMAVPIYFPSSNPLLIPAGGVVVAITYVAGNTGSGSGSIRVGYNNTARNTLADPATFGAYGTPGSVTIPRSQFVVDPNNPGRLRAFIHAELDPSSVSYRAFRFTAPSGYLIGFSRDAGSVFAVGNRNRCNVGTETYCGNFYDYNLDFAPNCGLPSGTARITIMDADSPGGILAAQYDRPVGFRVTNTTGGGSTNVPLSGSINYTNGATSTLTFNFVMNNKYRLTMDDVYTNNVIQVRLPFDSIYAYDPCPPPTQWDITGTTTTSGATQVYPGTTISFTHTVRNLGPGATDEAVSRQIYRSMSGTTGPWAAQGAAQIFAPPRAVGVINTTASNYVTTAADVGRTICEYMTYTPTSWSDPSTASTAPVCYTVGAIPRMSIVGGDAATGGGFENASGVCGTTVGGFKGRGTVPGSFGEYGLLAAPGIMEEFSSAGFAGNRNLSFANVATMPNPGNYDTSRCVKNLEPKLSQGVTFNTTYVAGPIPGVGNYRTAGNITIDASTLTGGGQRLIIATGDVTITGNLTYNPGPYSRFADVPRLIVIAQNIRVNSNVTQLDGLFIARANLTTCAEAGTSAINASLLAQGGICRANRLTLNGAIIANGQVRPVRSAGGENASAAPAEIIKFRPEVFLSSYESGTSTTTLKTDSETELPPRN